MKRQDAAKSEKRDGKRIPRLRNMSWRRGVKGITATFAALVLACWAGWIWISAPPKRIHIPIEIRLPAGTGLAAIGDLLQRNGVVRSGWAFAFYAATHAGGRALKPGRHILAGDMTFEQIVTALRRSETRIDEVQVTIPEGFTLEQIAARLDAAGVTERAAFLKAARDRDVIAGLTSDFPLPEETLEGYLFPDTYTFPSHTSPDQVLQAMVLNFGARFARPYQQDIARSPRGLHALVTEASLIEREARVPEDRARIAGVIENRLRRKMRLDIDASVLYALGHHKQRVTFKDLKVRSPYNTYRHSGLPPGPIACPGLPSLLAALQPLSSDYLYYVARPDGSHIFSRTLAEHEAAIRQARLERQAANGVETDPGG